MLDPVNGAGAGGMVTSAQDADIPVIAYDRFIAEADYYMSFDNETVGKMQGEALVEAMGDEGSILMLNGAPTDPNAAQFKAGAHSVIDESNLEILEEFDNPDWSPEKAQQFVTDQLSKYDPCRDRRRLRRQRRPGRRRHRRDDRWRASTRPTRCRRSPARTPSSPPSSGSSPVSRR